MTSSTRKDPSPRAISVAFTDRDTRLAVELDDGRVISAPLEWYPRLLHGTPQERTRWSLIGGGSGIHWPELDEDISVEGLLAGRRSAESQRSISKWLEGRPPRQMTR
jgi:hypothetical protein